MNKTKTENLSKDNSKITVGFAGMTHLGINSAVATAERGFQVLGFDENQSLIQKLAKQKLPIVEPDLPELFAKNCDAKKLSFSSNKEDLKKCDMVYIAADVPTNDKGESDLTPIRALIQTVVQNLNQNALLIILCQVPPGFTRGLASLIPLSRVYYQVETLVFGCAMHRALHPERFIVGVQDVNNSRNSNSAQSSKSSNIVQDEQEDFAKKIIDPRYFAVLTSFECPILPMRYESAELAKISINCCLVASVGVANTLSEICEKIGADWSEIVPALKLDKRIGAFSYLAPGLGLSGGNLERDLTTVLQLAENHGTDARIIEAWVKNSQYRKDWVLKTLHREVLKTKPKPTIAVLGLAYKENTHSTKNSPALALLECLSSYKVRVYDPEVDAKIVPFATPAKNEIEAMHDADALVIMTPWPQFRKLKIQELVKAMIGRVIIDPLKVLSGSEAEALGFKYLTLGC